MVMAALTPLATGATEVPPGGRFLDDDLSVHQGAIEAIAAAGITLGCNPSANTRFCPEDPVSRGQMAAFLVRALDLPDAGTSGFNDTGGTIFENEIDRLAASGITRGCNPPDNDRFCPQEPVSRGQMAAFLSRGLQLPPPTGDPFADDDDSAFEQDIEALHEAAITAGCNPPINDRYCPQQAVTRAEMATFLARALELEVEAVPARPYLIEAHSRAAWGAASPRGRFTLHEIEQITIHHAGSLNGLTGPAQFRSWQTWHQALGWPDIAYHFIVGRDGNVYEGRPYDAVGDTATEYDPTGHFLIVLEGNLSEDVPTAAQLEKTAQIIAWASLNFDVPVATLSGHRDHAATECPGDNLYSTITDGSLRARAEAIVLDGGVTLQIGN